MESLVFAEAPSNIAFIKYMGKVKGADRNRPTNSSFSYTLEHLRTRVEILSHSGAYDEWQPLNKAGWIPTRLSDRGRKRYLAHFEFLKQKMGVKGSFILCSANNFPSDCGIASSASSFAALTLATYELAKQQNKNLDLPLVKLAELSRIGSGSSIRSFMSPFVIWDAQGVTSWNAPKLNLLHQVIIVDKEKKAIGSSDAHERVTSSLLFEKRPERAEFRLKELLEAFAKNEWAKAYEIIWAEFWDMHALFATSQPPFQYMTDRSLKVLTHVQKIWDETKDGPLATMDAGANVHLFYRPEQKALADSIEKYCVDFAEVLKSK